jgi:hypothetical protein
VYMSGLEPNQSCNNKRNHCHLRGGGNYCILICWQTSIQSNNDVLILEDTPNHVLFMKLIQEIQ